MRMRPTFQRPRTAAQTSRRGTLVWQVGRRLSRRSPTVQGWIKVGFTFDLRAAALWVVAGMHAGPFGVRRRHPQRAAVKLQPLQRAARVRCSDRGGKCDQRAASAAELLSASLRRQCWTARSTWHVFEALQRHMLACCSLRWPSTRVCDRVAQCGEWAAHSWLSGRLVSV